MHSSFLGSKKDFPTLGDDENLEIALYNAVTTHSDSYGRVLSEPFMRLPSKRYVSIEAVKCIIRYALL